MVPRPVLLGLTLCDHVIVEERTRKVSLVGCFSAIRVGSFPATPPPFSGFALLTDGLGDATIQLSVSRMETQEDIYIREMPCHFPDRLTEVRVHFRIHQCVFPAPGWYQVTLLADGEWLAQRLLRVYSVETSS